MVSYWFMVGFLGQVAFVLWSGPFCFLVFSFGSFDVLVGFLWFPVVSVCAGFRFSFLFYLVSFVFLCVSCGVVWFRD